MKKRYEITLRVYCEEESLAGVHAARRQIIEAIEVGTQDDEAIIVDGELYNDDIREVPTKKRELHDNP